MSLTGSERNKRATSRVASRSLAPGVRIAITPLAALRPDRQELESFARRLSSQIYRNWRIVEGAVADAPRRLIARAAEAADYVLPLPLDATLAPHALALFALALNRATNVEIIYGDEDFLSNGKRSHPFFKTDWDPLSHSWPQFRGRTGPLSIANAKTPTHRGLARRRHRQSAARADIACRRRDIRECHSSCPRSAVPSLENRGLERRGRARYRFGAPRRDRRRRCESQRGAIGAGVQSRRISAARAGACRHDHRSHARPRRSSRSLCRWHIESHGLFVHRTPYRR